MIVVGMNNNMFKTLKQSIRHFFTFSGWVKIKKPPKWLEKKVIQYWDSHTIKYGTCPYNQTKHFYGKIFVYKVYYETMSQGTFRPIYYRKIRK